MELSNDYNHHEYGHIIDMNRAESSATSVSHSYVYNGSNEIHDEARPSTSIQDPASLSASRNISLSRRHDNLVRHHRSPLSSGLWISIELIASMSQILAAIIVLFFSRNERPRAPLFAWVIGYASGCVATLPHLYWRYRQHNRQGSNQASGLSQQSSFHNNASGSILSTLFFSAHTFEGRRINGIASFSRMIALVDRFKMALDCFFAVWFVVGNVWIFGRQSSVADAPNLYRLCITFLAFSCVGYAMPFILCATLCCCFPCIISILGFREDLTLTRGASSESINALPTYKFTSKRNLFHELRLNSEIHDGGILAAGTDKERLISSEDAACCICLGRYVEGDVLRELHCRHFFHVICVDKWLKINALCPLCKQIVGDAAGL